MNRLKDLLLIASILVSISACNSFQKKDYMILSGKIENYKGDNLKLMDSRFYGDDRLIKINSDGSFLDTLRMDQKIYLMRYAKSDIYFNLKHGSELILKADASDFMKSLTITGSDIDLNTYYFEKAKLLEIKKYATPQIFSNKEEEFLKYQKDFEQSLIRKINLVKGVSSRIKSLETRSIHLDYLSDLNHYEYYYSYYVKDKDFKASEEFKKALNKELDSYKLNDGELALYSKTYYFMIVNSLKAKINEKKKSDNLSYYQARYAIAKNIENDTISKIEMFDTAYQGVSSLKFKDGLYKKFMTDSKDESLKKIIKKQYDRTSKLDKGKPSPKFVNYENYAGETNSLDDFKGKYVYIDCWATWCGPCCREIPFLNEVEKKYHGKNIEFLSISFDSQSNKEGWRKKIKKDNMGGVQLIADKVFQSNFSVAYNILGIPRFILIDPLGNIVTASAPRPSSKKLIELFDKCGI